MNNIFQLLFALIVIIFLISYFFILVKYKKILIFVIDVILGLTVYAFYVYFEYSVKVYSTNPESFMLMTLLIPAIAILISLISKLILFIRLHKK